MHLKLQFHENCSIDPKFWTPFFWDQSVLLVIILQLYDDIMIFQYKTTTLKHNRTWNPTPTPTPTINVLQSAVPSKFILLSIFTQCLRYSLAKAELTWSGWADLVSFSDPCALIVTACSPVSLAKTCKFVGVLIIKLNTTTRFCEFYWQYVWWAIKGQTTLGQKK